MNKSVGNRFAIKCDCCHEYSDEYKVICKGCEDSEDKPHNKRKGWPF